MIQIKHRNNHFVCVCVFRSLIFLLQQQEQQQQQKKKTQRNRSWKWMKQMATDLWNGERNVTDGGERR